MTHIIGIDSGVGYGVSGRRTRRGVGVAGYSNTSAGVYGRSDDGYAAYLELRVYVRGYLTKILGFKQM